MRLQTFRSQGAYRVGQAARQLRLLVTARDVREEASGGVLLSAVKVARANCVARRELPACALFWLVLLRDHFIHPRSLLRLSGDTLDVVEEKVTRLEPM